LNCALRLSTFLLALMLKKIIFWTSLLYSFFYFLGSFLPSWILIRIRNLYAEPDPDPAAQINADPCGSGSGYGSGSETLVRRAGNKKIAERGRYNSLKNNKFLFSVFFE
jgi:hypothetical protein